MTVTELCKIHQSIKYQQHLIRRTSKDRNETTIKNQLENSPLGYMQIQAVTSKDIDDYFNLLISEGRLSVSSIEKVQYVLDSAFKWAVSRGDMRINPFDLIRDRLRNTFGSLKRRGADDADVKVLSDSERSLFCSKAE